MDVNDLKGRHLALIQTYLGSLVDLYPGIDEDQDQMLVRLAMLAHDEDPTNMQRADELLKGPGPAYVIYIGDILTANKRSEGVQAVLSSDGNYYTLTLPDDGREVTIRQLTGTEWRLALTDARRVARTAVMSGLSEDECGKLSLVDYLAVEAATVPFVSEVLAALISGGALSPPLSGEESDSET